MRSLQKYCVFVLSVCVEGFPKVQPKSIRVWPNLHAWDGSLLSVFPQIGSPRSSPSPRPSPPRLSVAVPDWSNHFLSGFETPSLKKEDSSPLPLVSLGNQNTPEVKEEDIESQFHDSTFEELKTITIQAQQNGSMAYSDAKVDKFEHIDVYTSRTIGLEVDDR